MGASAPILRAARARKAAAASERWPSRSPLLAQLEIYPVVRVMCTRAI